MKKMKYVYVRLTVQDGERQYTQHATVFTYGDNLWLAAIRYVATYFGQPDWRDSESWFFQGGEVATRMSTYEELTKEEFDLLNRILL
jgi:hypothetical protein